MKTSQNVVKAAGIVPKLRLFNKKTNEKGKDIVTTTGPHKVKLIQDKEVSGKDGDTGQPIPCIRYLVEENGERRVYETRKFDKTTGEVSYLVQRLAEIEENTQVILEGKRKGIKNYVEVTVISKTDSVPHEGGDDNVSAEDLGDLGDMFDSQEIEE